MNEKLIITTAEELEQLIKKTVSEEFEKASLVSNNIGNDLPKQSNLIYIKEASELIGLSPSTIRKKCHYGKIPYHKPKGTKCLVFKRDALLAWMESGKHDIRAELDHESSLVFHPKNRKR
jgi:excisionase family DNA binding protein